MVKVGENRWYGAFHDHAHTSSRNLVNAFLCFVALVPSVVLAKHWMTGCRPSPEMVVPSFCPLPDSEFADPLVQVNVLYFLNVSIGFWIVGLVQQSFWVSQSDKCAIHSTPVLPLTDTPLYSAAFSS